MNEVKTNPPLFVYSISNESGNESTQAQSVRATSEISFGNWDSETDPPTPRTYLINDDTIAARIKRLFCCGSTKD